MDAYGVFEGGGARGFALVGALRAAEARGIEFRAVAGTSAGAIVASLVAAGYTSSELFHQEEGGTPTGVLAENLAAQLLHADEYRQIRRFGTHWCWLTSFRGVSSQLSRYLYAVWWLLIVPSVALSPLVFLLHGPLLRAVWSRSGATGTELFRAWLNERLRQKLALPANEVARFRHLPRALRIVAADISKGQISVFSNESHGEMEVAEAVAASISYPFFFRPVRIGESIYVDGGLVSNFPAWVLDDLRAQQERSIPTFGFKLDPPVTEADEPWPGDAPPIVTSLARKLIAAMLGSRQSLESRQINDYYPINLQTHIRTLDFHLLETEARNLIAQGQHDVEEYFLRHIGPPREAREMEIALREIASRARTITFAVGPVRAYLLQRTDAHACRVVYGAFLEGDADDAMLIRWGTRSQALCLWLREPVLMRTRTIPFEDRVRPATKIIHALRPASVVHVYCIPIFSDAAEWGKTSPLDRIEPIAALCIDFAQTEGELPNDLMLLDPYIEDWLAALAQSAGEFWLDRILTNIPDLPDPAPPPSSDWVPLSDAPGYYVSGRKVRGPLSAADTIELDNMITTIQTRSRSLANRAA